MGILRFAQDKDSNSHGLSPSALRRCRVYQFRRSLDRALAPGGSGCCDAISQCAMPLAGGEWRGGSGLKVRSSAGGDRLMRCVGSGSPKYAENSNRAASGAGFSPESPEDPHGRIDDQHHYPEVTPPRLSAPAIDRDKEEMDANGGEDDGQEE